MYKLVLFSTLLTLVLFLPLNAKSTFNGQKVYLKECRTCHLGSNVFLNMHTHSQWKKVLDSDGKILSDIHLNKSMQNTKSKDGIMKNSHSFFKNSTYIKQYLELKNFIISSTQKNDKTL
ncbi:MAG: hypothetical protein L3I99_04775 [Sulfurimonas sp.]|nr:hypothetical protein [Sulfurimonas sp.]